MVTMTFGMTLFGWMFPLPIVPSVSTLKKKARPNAPPKLDAGGPVMALGPAGVVIRIALAR